MTASLGRAELVEIRRFVMNQPEWVHRVWISGDDSLCVTAWVENLGCFISFENKSPPLLNISSWTLLDGGNDDYIRHPNLDDMFCCKTDPFTRLDETVLGLVQLMAFPNFDDPAWEGMDADVYYGQFVSKPSVLESEDVHDGNCSENDCYPPSDVDSEELDDDVFNNLRISDGGE